MIEREFCEKERNTRNRTKKKVLLIVLKNEQRINQDEKEAIQKEYNEFSIRFLRVIGDNNDIKNKISQYMRRQSISTAKGDMVLQLTDIAV